MIFASALLFRKVRIRSVVASCWELRMEGQMAKGHDRHWTVDLVLYLGCGGDIMNIYSCHNSASYTPKMVVFCYLEIITQSSCF